MNYSEFERNAAKKINQYSSGVDGEALWSAIQPELPVRSNGRRGLFWLFLAGFLGLTAGLYSTNWNNQNSDPESTELSAATLLSEEPSSNLTEHTKEAVSENQSDPLIAKKATENKNAETTGSANNQKKQAKFEGKNRKSNHTGSSKKNKANSIKTAQKEPLAVMNSNIPSDEQDEGHTNAEISSQSEILNTEAAAIDKEETSGPTTAMENPGPVASESTANMANLPNDSLVAEEVPSEEIDLLNEEEKRKLSPPSRSLGLTFGFGIYGGISRSTAEFSLQNGTDPLYLQNRLNSEKQLETLQLGMEVIAQTDKNLYFRTGVQYSRIARRFAVDVVETSFDTIPDGIQAIYINNMTNDTIVVYGEVVKEKTTTYEKTTYNNFHLLDIPLLAGYSFSNDNWSLGVEAGAVFNISNQSKGEILDLNGAFYDLKTDTNDWYKTNIGLGLMAGLSAAYKIDYNFQVYVSPVFRTGSVFSTNKNPLEQKHATLGVNAGLRYFLD